MTSEKLSPAQFRQLQEYASYSTKSLKDIVPQLSGDGCLSHLTTPDERIGLEVSHFPYSIPFNSS